MLPSNALFSTPPAEVFNRNSFCWCIFSSFGHTIQTYWSCILTIGDRRIRVHTLILPVSDRVEDILAAADQQAIVSVLAKMAAEKVVMVRNYFKI